MELFELFMTGCGRIWTVILVICGIFYIGLYGYKVYSFFRRILL